MKKFAFLTAPFLCMTALALHADSSGEVSKVDSEFSQSFSGLVVDSMGQHSVQSSQKNGQKNDNQMMGQITPEAEPRVVHWADPFLTAEFIYWDAVQDGLDYAMTGVSLTGVNADKGRVHAPNSDFVPGFKLGFGLRFKHDGWDLYGNYTWLSEVDADSSARSDSDGDSTVTSMWDIMTPSGIAAVGLPMDSAKANWELQLNVLDLELGRNFYISPRLTLRPHFGFKFGWLSQDYDIKYDNMTATQGINYSIKHDQDFFGVGIRTGLDTVWYFARHVGLYADFAFAALWSDFDVSRKDEYASAIESEYKIVNNKNPHTDALTEVLELGIGLRYDTTFFVGDYAFYIQAGWEEQIWFNQNQLYSLSRDASASNLTFQGLSVKAGLMF